MAKRSSIEKNNRRRQRANASYEKRAKLKAMAYDKTKPLEERFQLIMKLSAMPRNTAMNRVRNRCEISGRPRGFYRKFKMSRIAIRDFASEGLIPGMTKSSW